MLESEGDVKCPWKGFVNGAVLKCRLFFRIEAFVSPVARHLYVRQT